MHEKDNKTNNNCDLKYLKHIVSSKKHGYLSNMSKNDKIDMLSYLAKVNPQELCSLKKKINKIEKESTILKVNSIHGWTVRLGPDSYFRLYKVIKNKTYIIQIGRNFSKKKAEKKIILKINQLKKEGIIEKNFEAEDILND